MRRNLSLLSLGVVGGLCTLALPTCAQADPPLNPQAVFRTAVAHHHSAVPAFPALPGMVTPATSAIFNSNSYAVGPTVTPTTTLPEAEEHIAVDPRNSNNLVSAISD